MPQPCTVGDGLHRSAAETYALDNRISGCFSTRWAQMIAPSRKLNGNNSQLACDGKLQRWLAI